MPITKLSDVSNEVSPMTLAEFEGSRDRIPPEVVVAFLDEIYRLKDLKEDEGGGRKGETLICIWINTTCINYGKTIPL
jgi:hypothetical protein